MRRQLIRNSFRGLLMVALSGIALGAQALDWSAVPAKSIPLFYPGQTGMEWIVDKKSHDGAARFEKRGKPCRECHGGEEKDFGTRIAAGGNWEPEPLSGRRGFVEVQTQVAISGGKLHLRLQWPDEASVAGGKQDPDHQAKVTVMLGDAGFEAYAQGGCWLVCHQDSRKMPAASGEGLTKYLEVSRTEIKKDVGGGESYKSPAELDALIQQGQFLEYWQAQLNPGAPAKAVAGYILKERSEHAGSALSVSAEKVGADWVVEFSRPLAGAVATEKTFAADGSYTIGLALHDQHTKGRFHIVSLEYQMKVGAGADIEIKSL